MHNQVNLLGYLYGSEQTFPFFVHAKTDFVSPDELEQLINQIRVIGVEAKIVCISNVTGVASRFAPTAFESMESGSDLLVGRRGRAQRRTDCRRRADAPRERGTLFPTLQRAYGPGVSCFGKLSCSQGVSQHTVSKRQTRGRIRLNLGTGPAKRQAIPRRRTDM